MPTFSPSRGSGLNLLAAAAAAARPGTVRIGMAPSAGSGLPHLTSLSCRGPYNPAAVLPTKVAKRILGLEFVEMSDISLDDLPPHTPGQPPLPARPPIQNISVWIEKFSVMAALIASRFPEKAPELFAYQASIVRAERNFDDRRWVSYDRCYRREALALKNLDWSVPNARLYNEAFTGHARAVPRCSFCLQEDHLAQYCPRNPNRPWFGWLGDTSLQPSQSPNHQGSGRGAQSAECCRRFNDGRCKQSISMCRYAHRCADCGGPHPRLHCTRGGHQGGSARPRSPLARPRQQGRLPGPPAPGRHY